MQIGYARVSTTEQNLDLQLDALRKAGCSDNHIFTDKITGTKQDRPGLQNALSRLRSGDTFVVWRLDRLARSLSHLIEIVNHLASRSVAFRSITEQIDTSSATGQLTFHLFGALAEFERNLIKERTIAGLTAARARGKSGGRPKRSATATKVVLAKKLYQDKAQTIPQICRYLGISRPTFFRYIKQT